MLVWYKEGFVVAAVCPQLLDQLAHAEARRHDDATCYSVCGRVLSMMGMRTGFLCRGG